MFNFGRNFSLGGTVGQQEEIRENSVCDGMEIGGRSSWATKGGRKGVIVDTQISNVPRGVRNDGRLVLKWLFFWDCW